ncbi:MAG: D-glycero-beta-D-manno-heptose-7-phosphate kinase, partial [Cytophagales bacterium]|nr:D-glycero-beta-D-manno-heptose-7-phosphate kinase [Cytophagales bacterium]
MAYTSFSEIFKAFNGLKVLIVGDVMIDSYQWGKVDRISPEAPVPIVHVQQREMRLGGASNVALNIQAMGAIPILCSVIGEDLDGDNFLKLLENNQLPSEGILRKSSRVTTIKHRIISGSHHMLRVDSEIDTPLSSSDRSALLERIISLIPQVDVIIFEDYDKGVIDGKLIDSVVSAAKSANKPIAVDPKKRNFMHYHGVTLFKPNLKEMKEGLKIDLHKEDMQELMDAVSVLKEKLSLEGALLTLSERGVFIDFKSQKHHLPAHIRDISDVSGAGDTVISVASLCLALGLSPRLIAGLSNLAGGLVCEYVGVVPIRKE